jgi:hypothetical protein
MCLKPAKAKKAENRTCRIQQIGAVRILWITAGKTSTAYRLEAIQSQIGGKGFKLTKADQGDGANEAYSVLVDGVNSSCDCKWGCYGKGKACRHIAALQMLVTTNRI